MKSFKALIPTNENPVLFFTATILNWRHLLQPDKYKDIILSSLGYMHEKQRMRIGAFVIMPNHIHLVFRPGEGHLLKDIQRDFLKFTSQQIKFDLLEFHPEVLVQFKSTQSDRNYQFWERRPLATPLYTQDIITQKINYIHNNPYQEKWSLVKNGAPYLYSSLSFYESEDKRFHFLIHYMDI